jgi:branched-chain amino acid transport system ATP-binding protein
MSVLQAHGLIRSFGGVMAVDDVSFSVAAGEIVALIGPNGAGKSTCFNILMGQLRPDGGRVEILGREVTGWPTRRIWRLGVGRTFQVAQTFGSFTVVQNVELVLDSLCHRQFTLMERGARSRGQRAETLLATLGIDGLARRACATLAYGDIKRVELAMALAGEPRLLLMDEPTAGMAPEERHALMRLVLRLAAEQGIAVLFTEHDMDVVFSHAERILVMARGRLIADGPPEAVRGNPEVQAVYLGEVPGG